jgi:hypothetical protein
MLARFWTLPCSVALPIFLWSLNSPVACKFVVKLEGPSLSVLIYTVTILMMEQNFFITRTVAVM